MSSSPSRNTSAAATSMTGMSFAFGVRRLSAGVPSAGQCSITPLIHPFRSPPDALVDEPQTFHLRRVEQIAAVEHDGMGKCLAGAVKVKLLELIPLRGDDQRVATLRHRVH